MNKTQAVQNAAKKYGIVLVLILLCSILSIAKPEFLSSSNIFNVLTQSSIYGIMAIGLTFVIISRGLDLSVGSLLALCAVILGAVSQASDAAVKIFPGLAMLPFGLAVLLPLGIGASSGAVVGFLVAKTKVHPFIATLGMQTILRGFALIVTQGKPVSTLNPVFNTIGGKIWGVIPVPVLIWLGVIVVSWVVLNYTRFGKSVYAIGSNSTAAEVSGINVAKAIIVIYMISGIMAALASVVFVGRTLSAHPGAASGYELTAIAATTIGGTSQTGGIGTIWGAVTGTLIIGVLRNGLTLLGVHAYWQQVIEGLIIIVAVVFDMRKNARSSFGRQ
jgi:inositol transport system permease protein